MLKWATSALLLSISSALWAQSKSCSLQVSAQVVDRCRASPVSDTPGEPHALSVRRLVEITCSHTAAYEVRTRENGKSETVEMGLWENGIRNVVRSIIRRADNGTLADDEAVGPPEKDSSPAIFITIKY